MEREVQVGQLIAGKYRVQQVLGRGGMGVVMAALHEHLNQRVALKFLTDDAYQQPEAVARFLREARAAVQIQSEHVARVMDVGTLDSGAPYIVMEYLRGLDLKEVSTRRGPLPVADAVDYVLQACDAVAEAHSLGIVHRDLKPSNLFLTERPDGTALVKVLDFGISKALNGGRGGETSKQQMTASAAIMGSPQYMSPEQIRSSKNVDARADVWALGTILHELLAGSPAYIADTVPGLLAMIVADPPPPLSASRPDAPPELEAIILRCLQKDREQRFANVAEFARALERYASPEIRPLVKRISRVLGESAPVMQSPLGTFGPGALTAAEVPNQTHNSWARTGRPSELASSPPFYARPTLQLGAGVGLVGVALVAWLLVGREASTGSRGPATVTSASPARPLPPKPLDVSPNELPPTTTGVRPLRAETPVHPVAPETQPPPQKVTPPEPVGYGDDDPRAARNFQDNATLYPSANAKKKDLAAAQNQKRGKPNKVVRPSTPVESDLSLDTPKNVSPEPVKKSNPLDLFNDTK